MMEPPQAMITARASKRSSAVRSMNVSPGRRGKRMRSMAQPQRSSTPATLALERSTSSTTDALLARGYSRPSASSRQARPWLAKKASTGLPNCSEKAWSDRSASASKAACTNGALR